MTTVSGDGGYRGEEDEEVKHVILEDFIEEDSTFHLGTKDLLHLLKWHLEERGIIKDHGTMANTGNRRVVMTEIFDESRQGGFVGDIAMMC